MQILNLLSSLQKTPEIERQTLTSLSWSKYLELVCNSKNPNPNRSATQPFTTISANFSRKQVIETVKKLALTRLVIENAPGSSRSPRKLASGFEAEVPLLIPMTSKEDDFI